VLTLWVGVATKLRQVRFRATGVLGLARVSALGGRLRSVTVTTFPVRQIPRFPGSPGARRSNPSSVPARSRWAQPVDPHGPRRRARSAGPAGFGMGSVGDGRFCAAPISSAIPHGRAPDCKLRGHYMGCPRRGSMATLQRTIALAVRAHPSRPVREASKRA
jgi:hypothetical protein